MVHTAQQEVLRAGLQAQQAEAAARKVVLHISLSYSRS